MADTELEEIKKRKMQEMMMQQMSSSESDNAEQQRQEMEKNAILRKILSSEARERLTSIKMARPAFGESIEAQLMYLARMGKIQRPLTDDEFKKILISLSSQRREIHIERR